ncbi:MAG: hypothetical protein MUF38_01525 [Anaerolineae bacterium]|jgi:hypothetical protein|nr:hypothetical protein [Anaerolineae bacterium]
MIKQTKKYKAACVARQTHGITESHKTADQLYEQLEAYAYWDGSEWVQRAQLDPMRAMPKDLIRIRVHCHMDQLEDVARIVVARLGDKFQFSQASRPYPNVRDVDGSGRVYIEFRNSAD